MKRYALENPIYLKENDDLIYKVDSYYFSSSSCLIYDLQLVAGWDYINRDYNDIQGWCGADNFIEDVQLTMVTQYFLEESFSDAVESQGYEIIDFNESNIR